jgi:hypothetical protein
MKSKHMKIIKNGILIILMLAVKYRASAQGFTNLNFESANVSGYPPGSGDVPISAALPGWSGYYGNNQTSQVWYDGISIGGAVISIIDNNAPSFAPLQGNYSAFLFGGGGPEGLSASISQTAVIPTGTESLLMDAWSYDASPIVAINGQPISMIPLQTFANYSLYGGTVPAADIGPSVTLSFTDPPPATGGPSMFELDNITFSTQAVPEPSPLALTAVGGLLFALYRRFPPLRSPRLCVKKKGGPRNI